MSNSIIATARQLKQEIKEQEEQLDIALAGQARLIGTLLDARRSAGVSARFGATALDRAFEAINHGREARSSMLAIHHELAQINLREVAIGDVSECPDEALRVVPITASSVARVA